VEIRAAISRVEMGSSEYRGCRRASSTDIVGRGVVAEVAGTFTPDVRVRFEELDALLGAASFRPARPGPRFVAAAPVFRLLVTVESP
jgi:hypothetical protein